MEEIQVIYWNYSFKKIKKKTTISNKTFLLRSPTYNAQLRPLVYLQLSDDFETRNVIE